MIKYLIGRAIGCPTQLRNVCSAQMQREGERSGSCVNVTVLRNDLDSCNLVRAVWLLGVRIGIVVPVRLIYRFGSTMARPPY